MANLPEDLTALATHIRKKVGEGSPDSHADTRDPTDPNLKTTYSRARDAIVLLLADNARLRAALEEARAQLAAHTSPSEAATEPEGVAMSQSSVQGLSEVIGLQEREVAVRSLWRDLAEARIGLGADWPYIVRTLFADIDRLRAVLAAREAGS